jgi:hypothetical protein
MPAQEVTVANRSNQAPAGHDRDQRGGGITPELVDEIAAKVYALLILELKIERERRRLWPYSNCTKGDW